VEAERDKLSAFATLYEVLTTFTHVLAPVLPFVTEHLYQDLIARHDDDAARSVHHRDFPIADGDLIDDDLERSMAAVREVVRLGRNLRKREGHRVRQPLSSFTILTRDPGLMAAVEGHAEIIADELNVRAVEVSDDESALVELTAKANFRLLGPNLGPRMPEVAEAISRLGQAEIESLLAGGTVMAAGHPVTVGEVIIDRLPREGMIVETGADFACVLDTTLTEELVREGLAREIVSRVQQMRRDAGLAVTDRIELGWASDDADLAAAFEAGSEYIGAEVLANKILRIPYAGDGVVVQGRRLFLELTRAD
jgi:isoleucyl-tRNA synthetase